MCAKRKTYRKPQYQNKIWITNDIRNMMKTRDALYMVRVQSPQKQYYKEHKNREKPLLFTNNR